MSLCPGLVVDGGQPGTDGTRACAGDGFSFGLAILVTAVGTAVVLFGDRIRSLSMGGRLSLALPVFSAVVVTALGIGLTWDGLIEVVGGV